MAAVVTVGFSAAVLLGWAVPAIPPAAVALTLGVCLAGGLALDCVKVALFGRLGIR